MPGWRRRRARLKLSAWLLAPVALLAAAFQLQPTYIRLDIPVPKNPVGYFWYEAQRSQLAYADAGGVLYLYRQAGTGYAEPQGWHSIEDAFATFDSWFKSNGWNLAGAARQRRSRATGKPSPRARQPAGLLSRRQFLRARRTRDLEIRWTRACHPRGAGNQQAIMAEADFPGPGLKGS